MTTEAQHAEAARLRRVLANDSLWADARHDADARATLQEARDALIAIERGLATPERGERTNEAAASPGGPFHGRETAA